MYRLGADLSDMTVKSEQVPLSSMKRRKRIIFTVEIVIECKTKPAALNWL
jgi:hypothetical protein